VNPKLLKDINPGESLQAKYENILNEDVDNNFEIPPEARENAELGLLIYYF
jgi:hypothetical protein